MTAEVDHIAVWTPERDAALQRLSAATDLPILDGYAPDGAVAARGVRFSNGPFLDVHQSHEPGPVLLGLACPAAEAEALAARSGWRVKRTASPDEPWDIVAVRKGQGVASLMFFIDVHPTELAAAPAFNRGLYSLAPGPGPRLSRVWISARDPDAADQDLAALGYIGGGEAVSPDGSPAGHLWRGGRADLLLCRGEDDAVFRIDIATSGPRNTLAFGPGLTAAIGHLSGPDD